MIQHIEGDIMNKLKNIEVLDISYPDESFLFSKKLMNYFSNLHIPLRYKNLIGIYLEFEGTSKIYEKNTEFYKNYTYLLISDLIFHLSIEKTSLYQEKDNCFFITLFDSNEKDIIQRISQLNTEIYQKYQFQIRSGIYITQSHINCLYFYHLCKEEFINALQHQSFLSIKTSLLTNQM